jgi:hypothetical protein
MHARTPVLTSQSLTNESTLPLMNVRWSADTATVMTSWVCSMNFWRARCGWTGCAVVQCDDRRRWSRASARTIVSASHRMTEASPEEVTTDLPPSKKRMADT